MADPYSTPLQPSIGSCTSGSERFYACRLCRLPMQNALLLRGSLPAWGVGCLLGSSSQSPSPFCFSVHLHHPSPQASKPPLRTELHTGWRQSKMRCNATVPFVASAFTAASQLTHITTCKHATAIPSHSIHIPFQPSAVQADPDPRPPTAVTHDPPSSPSKNRASKPRPGLKTTTDLLESRTCSSISPHFSLGTQESQYHLPPLPRQKYPIPQTRLQEIAPLRAPQLSLITPFQTCSAIETLTSAHPQATGSPSALGI